MTANVTALLSSIMGSPSLFCQLAVQGARHDMPSDWVVTPDLLISSQ